MTRFRVLLFDHEVLQRDDVQGRLVAMDAFVQSIVLPVSEARGVRGATFPGDVAVVRSEYPDGAAVEAVIRLHELGWSRVIVVGTNPAPDAVADAMAAGARGYVAVVPPSLTVPAPADHDVKPAQTPSIVFVDGKKRQLSSREIVVLEQVADGKTNKEIGAALGISALTVKSHLARIGKKLETGDRARMTLLALRSGCIL
jgi:DNA-binding NarL/FixJ family response regulator